MRVAVPIWGARISPVLDTATTLRLFRNGEDSSAPGADVALPADPLEKIRAITQTADIVICGAVSNRMEQDLVHRGVTVHPWVMGEVDSVMDMWRCGRIGECEQTMPGCGRRGHGRGRRGCGGFGGRGRR